MGESDIVKKIADYIENHIEEDLPLDKIAEELHYSKYYLARIFAEKTGCTIYRYIQGRRLTLAAQELVETKKPIVEIACEAHYGSQQAFTLAFEQRYLCTPQVYRKRGVFYPVQSGIGIQGMQCVSSCAYGLHAGHILTSHAQADYVMTDRALTGYAQTKYTFADHIAKVYIRGGAIAA